MKSKRFFLFNQMWFLIVTCGVSRAATEPVLRDDSGDRLEAELQQLGMPVNQAPMGVSAEQLYAVQSRLSPLKYRSELSLAGSKNFTADSFLISQGLDLGYRFYVNERWFLGASASVVFNQLSDAGQRLLEQSNRLPDLAYAKHRADLMLGAHLFYGKFRLTMDQVFYFDQYVALGPGLVVQDLGSHVAAVADVGFVFWVGRDLSFRFGLKDYLFHENRRLSQGLANNLMGHLDFGYVFGGG